MLKFKRTYITRKITADECGDSSAAGMEGITEIKCVV